MPGLVRHLGLEPHVGGLRSFRGLRRDQAVRTKIGSTVDRDTASLVVVCPGASRGLRARVKTLLGQFLAQPQDQVDLLGRDGAGRGLGARERGSNALSLVADSGP